MNLHSQARLLQHRMAANPAQMAACVQVILSGVCGLHCLSKGHTRQSKCGQKRRFTELQVSAHFLFCRLGVLYDMPGMFYIGKLLRNTPHREAFTVNSHGFWFRREVRQWGQLLVSGSLMHHSAAPNAV